MDGQDGGSEPINPPNPQAGASPVPENSDGAMADNNATMGTGVGAGGALASTGGPIFSDPSLTIEKDAIPEEISGVEREMDTPVTAVASGNAGRVAAAFASTDASRGAAMVPSGSNAMTQSTATGDIRLAPTPRKKMSKLPFIIGAGVLAIVVIVAALLLTRGGGGDTMQSFSDYYDYSQRLFGGVVDDVDIDNDEGEDWRSEEEQARVDQIEDNVEPIDEGEDNTDETEEGSEGAEEEIELSSETIGELRRKFDIFKQDAESSRVARKDSIKQKIAALDQYILIAERAVAVEKAESTVIEAYTSGGEDGVRDYIKGMILDDQEDDLYAISDAEADYYAAFIEMYIGNERIGCVRDGEVDYDCVVDYYGGDDFQPNLQDSELTEIRDRMSSEASIGVIGQKILNLNAELKAELEQS